MARLLVANMSFENGEEQASSSATDKTAADDAAQALASDVAYEQAVAALAKIDCFGCPNIKAEIDLGKATITHESTSTNAAGRTIYEATAKCTWALWAECTDQVGQL